MAHRRWKSACSVTVVKSAAHANADGSRLPGIGRSSGGGLSSSSAAESRAPAPPLRSPPPPPLPPPRRRARRPAAAAPAAPPAGAAGGRRRPRPRRLKVLVAEEVGLELVVRAAGPRAAASGACSCSSFVVNFSSFCRCSSAAEYADVELRGLVLVERGDLRERAPARKSPAVEAHLGLHAYSTPSAPSSAAALPGAGSCSVGARARAGAARPCRENRAKLRVTHAMNRSPSVGGRSNYLGTPEFYKTSRGRCDAALSNQHGTAPGRGRRRCPTRTTPATPART